MNHTKKIFLLDAYALIYRSYFAFIKNPRINSKGLNTSAIFGFTTTLEQVLSQEKPSHIGVVFDPKGGSFRNEIYKEYKANREETPEDIRKSIPYIKRIIEAFNIPVVEVQNYEADDVIGTLSVKAANEGFEVYMMTPDKDYAQLVNEKVFMFKPKRMSAENEVWGIEEVTTNFNVKYPKQVIDILALWGDSSDNIPGAPGVGEKTAQKLIALYQSVENLLTKTNELKGKQKENIEQNIDQILLSKRLATIALDAPVDFIAEEYEYQKFNTEKLQALFEELEFKTLAGRILFSSSQQNYIQTSLFADPTETSVFQSKFKTSDDEKQNYRIVENKEDFFLLRDILQEAETLSVETLSINEAPKYPKLTGLAISWKPNHAAFFKLPMNEEQGNKLLELIKPFLENEHIEKIGHDLKKDISALKIFGIELKGKLFDNMLAHYLLHPELKHDYHFLAQSYINYQPNIIKELEKNETLKNPNDPFNPIAQKVMEQTMETSDINIKLKTVLADELSRTKLNDLANELEFKLIPALVDMELAGVKVDIAELHVFSQKLSLLIDTSEKEIIELAGTAFNVSSPKQLGDILFDKLMLDPNAKKTKSGQYSTNEETLEKLLEKHPIIQKILDFRGYKKLQSTYVQALPLLRNPQSGKIHTSYNQAVTATGRLSSVNPNLQNIPIREELGREIRKAFIPSNDDYRFFSADYSQIELRLMAHLSQDENLKKAFKNNEDIHTATASLIFGVPLELVSREMRAKAKTANFGIIYGISAFGLSQRLNISRSEGKELIDGYFASYPGVKRYMDYAIEKARENGFVETIFGRKRTLSDINSRNAIVRGIAERNAINAPIQGSAADIIKLAMIRIHDRFKTEQLKSKMILQVHDELNFDLFLPEEARLKEIVIYEMENAVSLSVPMKVEFGIGKNWLEAH